MTTQREALEMALEAHQAMREWIKAVPEETTLPAMPGCAGDWLDSVEHEIKEALAQPESDAEKDYADMRRFQEKYIASDHEVIRLRECLRKANSQAEHFKREWYLRGDEIERLKAQPEQECDYCGGFGEVSGEYPGVACQKCHGTGSVCTGTVDGVPELFDCPQCSATGYVPETDFGNIAQPEQEPIGFIAGYYDGRAVFEPMDRSVVLPKHMALYAAPPKREWVGLTEEEIGDIASLFYAKWRGHRGFARVLEAKLKEKNT